MRKIQSKIAVLLSLLMIVTLFSSVGVPSAFALIDGPSGGGLTLTGYDSTQGKESNPYINYESKITLSGTYASGINGENLRLKIYTNNGDSEEDLSSTKPAVEVSTRTFTFRDVELKAGMNRIVFYETNGSVTNDLLAFFVQYNNTPVLSELEVEDVDLISDPTVIRIPSSNSKRVTVTGKAVNADSVKVVNKTTGKAFVDDVNQSGTFAVDVDVLLGVNKFDIVAFNSSREVGLKERSIVVTLTGGVQGEADQFYSAGLYTNAGSTTSFFNLEPEQTPIYSPTGAAPTTFTVKGTSLVYAPSTVQILAQLDTTTADALDTINNYAKVITVRAIDPATNASDVVAEGNLPTMPTMKNLSGDFKQFDVSADINLLTLNPGFTWQNGWTYEVEMGYKYVKSATSNGNTTKSDETAVVKNYSYKFKYVDSSSPRINSVVNKTENKTLVLGDDEVNSIKVSPLVIKINGANIGAVDLYFNDSPTKLVLNTDYTFNDTTDEVTLTKLPPGETKVRLVGQINSSTSTPTAEVEFVIKPEIAPFLELSYDNSGKRVFVDSTLNVTDLTQVPDLDVKVTNYTWTPSTDKVYLNGVEITEVAGTSPYHARISKTLLNSGATVLKSGSNELKFEMVNVPNAIYTYTIFYSNQKLPTLENVQFKVEQNKDDITLEKKSDGNSYETSAFFLSEFSFSVKDATSVQVLKDGNVIASYKYASGNWSHQSADVDKARKEAVENNSDLEDVFDNRNFPISLSSASTQNRTFTANMTSRQYGNELLDELESLGLSGQELEDRLELFPLTLSKGATTNYEIVVSDGNVASRHKLAIKQNSHSWEILSPLKEENAPYAMVNSNNVPIKIFAENATKVLFGKTEAIAHNTDKPDFEYNEELGKSLPQSYYVFEANVPLKAGLNTIKYSVVVAGQTYTDEVKIFNVNSTISGAESRDTLGKKLSFSVFDKALELKFPKGTVLVAPSIEREGNDVRPPATDVFTDVPIYFAMADRTTGKVNLDDSSTRNDMEDILQLTSEFNYASPLYYIDAGNAEAGGDEDERQPGGRDPYFEGEINGKQMDTFIERWENNLVPSEAGTLTIQYDPSIVNAANNIMTVFYNNGDEWINLGGVVNTSKKVITVPFKGFGYYMVMKTKETFTDVIHHDFARDAIETLFAKGIMMDAPGTGFGTELKISRGEFTTMLVKALDLPINAGPYEGNDEDDPTSPTFRDVRPSGDIDWKYQYKYIETAARAGIVRGKDTRAFFPDDSLTREEAAIMISRALNLKTTGNVDVAKANLLKLFTDGKDVGTYAAPAVLAVTKAKIMNGEPNDATAKKPTYRFSPQNDLTRAEMAVITIRILVQLKKLPKQ
ncbi:MAG TPA: S-layer homology domain-containing protein [Candidatus Bathyarchaeia archaeon]|nr:S-layer homology domain-containing protein [Candidatus Bathyarchaeia archaeon]